MPAICGRSPMRRRATISPPRWSTPTFEGRKLDEMEFNFFFLLLLIAGNETTRTVTSNGMISLLDHPDQLHELRNDLSLIPSAVEEILRFSPAVHTFRRTALRRARTARPEDPRARQAAAVVSVGEPRRGRLRRTRPLQHPAQPERAHRLRLRRALLPGRQSRAHGAAGDLPRHRRRGCTTSRRSPRRAACARVSSTA